jgi:hypothetical protein
MGGRRLTPSTFRGSIGIVIGSALAVVLLASCSSGQAAAPPSPKSTTTVSVADPTTTPQTETTLSTAPPGVSPPPTSGLPACTLSQLTVSPAAGDAAASHEAILLSYVNQSDSPCILMGYPSVTATGPSGSVTGTPTGRSFLGGIEGGSTLPIVQLDPGHSASDVVEGEATPAPSISPACGQSRFSTIEIVPPGSTNGVTISAAIPEQGLTLPSCGGFVDVTPFTPGVQWHYQ